MKLDNPLNLHLFQQLLEQEIHQACQLAISEDIAHNHLLATELAALDLTNAASQDITATLIPKNKLATASLITRETGILCGVDWVEKIFQLLGNRVILDWNFKDGELFNEGDTLCTLTGNARDLLTGERSAMNFLQTLSATATLTASYVEKIKHTRCKLLDTRKTIPGMRFGQKYAVKCGGGSNHRLGLSDAFLIKENHILACGGIQAALTSAKQNHPNKLLEIEVESLDELKLALNGHAQVIMLDNFNTEQMLTAKHARDNHTNKAKLEASGNIDLMNLASIAETGVDFISVGALTKNIKAVDLSMRVILE